MSIDALPNRWRARAADVREWAAAEGAAQALEKAAEELDAALRTGSGELMTLTDAATASGYSADHIGRLVRTRAIPNHGRRNAPRVRLADLPLKAGALPAAPELNQFLDTRRIALGVVNSKGEHDG